MISDIHFGNKNNLYNALVDSGSDVSLIDWSVFDKIPCRNIVKFARNNISPLNSASGHNIETIGKATVRMSMNGQYYVLNFILTKGFKLEVLIGSDFIYDHGAKLDFANNTMIIKNKVIILKSKNELCTCSLLEAVHFQNIEPYSIAHIQVKVRSKSYYRKDPSICMITPLDNCKLFDNQPGLVSPSVIVH